VSIEERFRIAAETTADTVKYVRPLTLPKASTRFQFFRSASRRTWSTRLMPLTGAVAVIAVAATLLAVKGTATTTAASQATPHATATSSRVPTFSPAPASYAPPAATSLDDTPAYAQSIDGIPKYDVEISDGHVHGNLAQGGLVLQDSSRGGSFYSTSAGSLSAAAAADDMTFVLADGNGFSHTFDVLNLAVVALPRGPIGPNTKYPQLFPTTADHITAEFGGALVASGGTSSATGRKSLEGEWGSIPIASKFTGASIQGLAVSPNGSTMAVLSQTGTQVTLGTYSVATGKSLRSWTTAVSGQQAPKGTLTWLNGGNTVAFEYAGDFRTLNTAGPSGNLLTDSREEFSVPAGATGCLPTLNGKSVFCGVLTANGKACSELAAYSVTTGKLTDLYKYHSACSAALPPVIWAQSSTLAITTMELATPNSRVSGTGAEPVVVTPSKLTELPLDPTTLSANGHQFAF